MIQPEEAENFDLNQPPLDMDFHAVIINPLQPAQEGEFIQINDFQENVQEQHLLQHENEVYLLNPQEQEVELMQLADEIHQEQLQNLPINLAPPVNWIMEEVPLDQLVGPEDEGFPEQGHPIPEQIGEGNGQQNQQAIEQVAPQWENQIMPNEEEIFDALIAENNLHNQPQIQNNNIQLGMALIRNEEADPAWTQARNAEATRLWAQFFSSVDEATGLDTANSEQGSASPDKKKRNHKRAIAIVETEAKRKKPYPVARARIIVAECSSAPTNQGNSEE
ncbi:unnamed protein product [Miscanthus lutarioriparius]|uniref:Uncharacterized protein n=1 Tax=Miscanthus lutarioriparius TaxID=422564 RepID=A0A811R9W0_9POAL|nr:unnamed protein product [Miscanthus lutarioriparius]